MPVVSVIYKKPGKDYGVTVVSKEAIFSLHILSATCCNKATRSINTCSSSVVILYSPILYSTLRKLTLFTYSGISKVIDWQLLIDCSEIS